MNRLILFPLLFFTWLIYETLYVRITRLRLDSESDIRSVQISDIHSRLWFLQGRLSSIVNNLSPDIVFITGDLSNKHVDIERVLEEVARIKCKYILFIPGNYERENTGSAGKYLIDDESYFHLMDRIGRIATVLENEYVTLQIRDRIIDVYGFDNSIYGKEKLPPRSNSSSSRTILLAHSPNIISLVQSSGIKFDALLTGHTHGGQVRLLGRTTGAYKHFSQGINASPRGLFYINRGLGTTRLPFRLGSPPEVLLLNL